MGRPRRKIGRPMKTLSLAHGLQDPRSRALLLHSTKTAPTRMFRVVVELSRSFWGRYQVTPTTATEYRIDFQLMGWLPRQLCAQVVGGAGVCRPYKPMYGNSATVNITSASSFEANGPRFRRDPSPYFLQIQVPEILERQTANASGYIRQPIMPTLHPYQTPGGAGSVGAMRYDDQHQQPYRTCAVNNGSVYTTQDGVQHCSN
jgi:hypothetical protein